MRPIATVMTIALCLLPGSPARADTADNLRLARRVLLENMGAGHVEHLDEIYGPDFVAHAASLNYTLAQDQAATDSWRVAMPDLKVTVARTVAASDLVAVHWNAAGTNTVVAGGMPGKGAHIAIEGMTFFRFAAGRIVEEWSIVDVVTLGRQLNATSATSPAR